MVDSVTESCIQSVRRANEELLEISEKTILSLPPLLNVPSSLKAKWLGKEQLEKNVKDCLIEYKVDERFNAVTNLDSNFTPEEDEKSVLTEKEILIRKKKFLKKEIEQIKEKQALVESAIYVCLNRLEQCHTGTVQISSV